MAKERRKKKTIVLSKGRKKNLSDIYGVLLITFSFLLILFTFTQATGLIGRYINLFLEYLVGTGRFLIPFFLLIWGLTFFYKTSRIDQESMGIGLTLCFLSQISAFHSTLPLDKIFRQPYLWSYGGLLGAIFSYTFKFLLGGIGAFIVFTASFIIGLIFAVNISFPEIVAFFTGKTKNILLSLKTKKTSPAWPFKELKQEQEPKIETSSVFTSGESEKIEDFSGKVIDFFPEIPFQNSSRAEIKLDEEKSGFDYYKLPPLELLKTTPTSKNSATKRSLQENIQIIEKTLHDFDVEAEVSKASKGPTVTRYEIQLASGVKVNRIVNLADDIALALASSDVRIQAPIPGKSAIGVEVPNEYREIVTLGDILTTKEGKKANGVLSVGIGKDITGQPVIANLGEMPHLLVAGATGSGKSICINSILTSLLMKTHPKQVKMILVDPKRVELSLFNNIPHLLTPVVTETKQTPTVLGWVVEEMEKRFQNLSEVKEKNITGYNKLLAKNGAKPEEMMPYIVVIIDELADLMMVSPREVEDAVCRLAQMARAVGIHLVIATQRPSTDVITGLIKANITTRVAFAVLSQTDSRVILDTVGAEKLVGKGDMLFLTPSIIKPRRVQGAFITEREIKAITDYVKSQARPEYNENVTTEKKTEFGIEDYEDEFLDQAMELVVRTGKASVSFLQRRLRVGYSRAARLMDMLEERGIVGELEGSKPRPVLITPEDMVQIRKRR